MLMADDGNNDDTIDNTDKNETWFSGHLNTGYLNGDFNRNSQVDLSDIYQIWMLNAGKNSGVIE